MFSQKWISKLTIKKKGNYSEVRLESKLFYPLPVTEFKKR